MEKCGLPVAPSPHWGPQNAPDLFQQLGPREWSGHIQLPEEVTVDLSLITPETYKLLEMIAVCMEFSREMEGGQKRMPKVEHVTRDALR